MKKRLSILFVFLTIFVAVGQTDSTKLWKINGDVGLNITQIGFSNWAQGGENSTAGIGLFHINANYKKNKWYWENYFGTEYGLMQQGSDITKKTDDLIEYKTKAGRMLNDIVALTFFGSFKTQYKRGYDYDKSNEIYISDFMAPAYTILGLGFDYKPKPFLSIYFSPATFKQVYVGDDTLAYYGAFGVQKQDIDENGNIIPFKNSNNKIGAYFDLLFEKEIVKNVSLKNSLNLYSNYLKNPQNIDVEWKVEIIMKVNDYLNASIKTHLIYEDEIDIAGPSDDKGNFTVGPKTQFKEAVAIGLVYKFGVKE